MGFRTPSDATVERIGTTTYCAAPKWTTVAPLTIGSSGGTALTLAGDNFTDTFDGSVTPLSIEEAALVGVIDADPALDASGAASSPGARREPRPGRASL